jgi:uncharacterized protein YecE (DUF72 family)
MISRTRRTIRRRGSNRIGEFAIPAAPRVVVPASHRIRVGTSSWADPGFIADWYPPKLPAKDRLAWYAQHFDLVEVNSSFYAVPRRQLVERWAEQTPKNFLFDVKLHRLLSRHSTDLKFLPTDLRHLAGEVGKVAVTPKLERALVRYTLEALEPLAETGKLGALLLQLTPAFSPKKHSLDELDHLLELLDGQHVAVELRNRHWVEDELKEETIEFFTRRKVTLVMTDGPPGGHFMIMPELTVTTYRQLAYLRAHGRNTHGYVSGRTVADRFDYDYSDDELVEIAERAFRLAKKARNTHVLYNNNRSDYAPKAASRFRQIVGQKQPQLPLKAANP